MINRKLQLISKELADLMIAQIAHELKNHNLYKSFANFFSVEGISDLEEYYNKRAHEEYNHHQWLIDFLNEADVKIIYPMIEKNTEVFEDYVTPFKQTVDREILTTQMLYKIYEQATTEKDFMTASWMFSRLIPENLEEENLSRLVLTVIEEERSDIFIKASQILKLIN